MNERQQHFQIAFFHNQKDDDYGQDFNQFYAGQSPELNLEYDPKEAEIQFQPILDTLHQSFPDTKDLKILEIGGSSGILSRKLQDQGAQVTMVETQSNFVNKARERGVDAKIYNGSDLSLVLDNSKFDAIIANRVFEDIVMSEYQSKRILSQANKLLQPNGLLIVGTQNPNAVWENSFNMASFKREKVNQSPWHGYITQVSTYKRR